MYEETCEGCKSAIMKTFGDGTDWDWFCETKNNDLRDGEYYFSRCNEYKKKPDTMKYEKCKGCDDLDIRTEEGNIISWFCKDKNRFLDNIPSCGDYKKKPEVCGYCRDIIKTEKHYCLPGLVMEAD